MDSLGEEMTPDPSYGTRHSDENQANTNKNGVSNKKKFSVVSSKIRNKQRNQVEKLLGTADKSWKKYGSWYVWVYFDKVYDEWDGKTKHLVVRFSETAEEYPSVSEITSCEKGDVVDLGTYYYTFSK